MKHIVCTLLLLFTLSTAVDAAPRHRSKHSQSTAQVDSMTPETHAVEADEGIEVYSDTSGIDSHFGGYGAPDADDDRDNGNMMNPESYDNPFSWYGSLWTLGIGGVMLALTSLIILVVIIALPIVLLIVLLRYLSKRRSDNQAYHQAVLENGEQPMESPTVNDFDEYTWRRGISTAAVGVGLILLSLCWGSSILIGIGCLVLCIGLGRMYIGRTTKRQNNRRNDRTMGNGNQNQGF